MGEEGLPDGETEIAGTVDIEGQGYDPRCSLLFFICLFVTGPHHGGLVALELTL